MKDFIRNDLLLSLCGLNCGLCPRHLDGHCPGCGGGEGNQSEPAVKFNVVENLNDWAKEIKKADNVMNATKKLKLDYWTAFNEYAF